jgi:hypothetical protein
MLAWLGEQLQNWRRDTASAPLRPNPANLEKIRSLGYL